MLRRWAIGFLAASVLLPIIAVIFMRRGVISAHESQGYVGGLELMTSYMYVIGFSVLCALLGLLLSVAGLLRLTRPRPLSRGWESLAFLIVPVGWYVLWGDIYVWLSSKP